MKKKYQFTNLMLLLLKSRVPQIERETNEKGVKEEKTKTVNIENMLKIEVEKN